MTTFTVVGTPKPQGSKRAYINRRTGKPVLTESAGAPLKDWRTDVQQAAIRAQGVLPPLDGPVRVTLRFALTRPKSHPKTRETWPTTRPDIDKLTRAVLDSVTHICFNDDSQVTDLLVFKQWGDPPGVTVIVEDARGTGQGG